MHFCLINDLNEQLIIKMIYYNWTCGCLHMFMTMNFISLDFSLYFFNISKEIFFYTDKNHILYETLNMTFLVPEKTNIQRWFILAKNIQNQQLHLAE